jgi:hypothetical protein
MFLLKEAMKSGSWICTELRLDRRCSGIEMLNFLGVTEKLWGIYQRNDIVRAARRRLGELHDAAYDRRIRVYCVTRLVKGKAFRHKPRPGYGTKLRELLNR